jgi:two-component system cell cycle sensor histidine kinase/response regulator CckA
LVTVEVSRRYRVLEASGPWPAIDLFDLGSADVDLLVTDVLMPEMSGPALTQRLVGIRTDLLVLFIAACADMATRLSAENDNVSSHASGRPLFV